MDLEQIDGDLERAKQTHNARPARDRDPDVTRLLQAAEQLRAYVASIHGPHTDDPMPVFVLKGKDTLAPGAIGAYLSACRLRGLDEQAQQVARASDEFLAWQERNPGRLKLPYHVHVPVGDALQKRPYCCPLHSGRQSE